MRKGEEVKVGDNEAGLDPEIERLSEKWARDSTSLVFAPLADAYRRSSLVDEAIQVLEKGLKNHPNYTSARIVLGRCYQDKRMFELAREEFKKVLSFDPHNFVALQLMGDVSLSMGQKDAAMDVYKHLLELQPNNVKAREVLEGLEGEEKAEEVVPPEPEKPEPTPTPDTSFADYFGTPVGLSETAESSVESRQSRELPTSLDPHAVLSEAEPVAELEASPETGAEVPPPSPEEKARGFSEYLEPEPAAEERATEESEVAPPEGAPPGKPIVTVTLAEIYERQGFKEKALETYQQLLNADPTNAEIRARVEELSRELHPEGLSEEVPGKTEEVAGKVEEVPLTDFLQAGGEEEAPTPPTGEEKEAEEEKPPPETAEKMDLQSFQSWLQGLKGRRDQSDDKS